MAQRSTTRAAAAAAGNDDDDIHLLLVGDCMLGRSMNKAIEKYPHGHIWGDMLPVMHAADIVVGNLETTISDVGDPFPGRVFHFRLLPRLADRALLAPTSTSPSILTVCSLANNHAMDFGAPGMQQTNVVLDNLGVAHAGSGITLEEAQRPTFLRVGSKRIGFLSATDHPRAYAATRTRPGVWFVRTGQVDHPTWLEATKAAQRARQQCDFLVFSLHWGANYVDRVPRAHRVFARRLIDAGVDVVHGHSAHHVLPVERYKKGLIFYSMADFIDDYRVDQRYRNDLAFAADVRLSTRTGASIRHIHPTRIRNFRVGRLPSTSADYRRVVQDLTRPLSLLSST